jgi:hypothetical protein
MTEAGGHANLALIRLRRDGEWPLRFPGRRIAHHAGSFLDCTFPRAPLWHDLGLYRDAQGRYVVEIVARGASGFTRFCAAQVDTLDAAIALFEAYPAADDLCPGLSAPAVRFDDPTVSAASLATQLAMLRHARHDVERHYRICVGAFLMTLVETDV